MSNFKATVKCTKFDFDWGSAPDPARGAYSAPPDPHSWILGVLLLREGGEKGEGGKGRKRVRREGERKEGGRPQLSSHPPPQLGVSRNMPGANFISCEGAIPETIA